MSLTRAVLALSCLGVAAEAAELSPAVVSVRIEVPGGAAPLESRVSVERRGRAQVVQVRLRNASDADTRLARVRVELPWVDPKRPGLLLATGGTEMGDLRPQVRRPDTDEIRSGAYLLARYDGGSSLLGLITWNTFWTKLAYAGGSVSVEADGEGRLIRAGETVAMETLWLAEEPHWQDLLYAYADEIARSTAAKPRKPMNYVGWGTWDYFGRTWQHEDVVANVEALVKAVPEANLLQIDGGWWPHRGDYGLLKPSLPKDSLKTLAALAKSKGLVAGLHLDGMRGDLNAVVAKEHPEYFLHDQHGKPFVFPQPNDGDQLHHVYFDFSNPAACEYMRAAIANIRHNWGFDYIKIDFLRFGIAEKMLRVTSPHGPAGRTIKPFDPGLTSVERIRRGMAAFRAGMGDDAYFLGCSAVFGLTFGFVDGLRTGDDIYPEYPHLKRLAVENGGNFYLHGRVVYNDADYNLVRGQEDQDGRLVNNRRKNSHLTRNEVEMWSHYVGLFGGPVINSDDLPLLREERLGLFQVAAALPKCDRYVPIDFWQHGRNAQDAPTVFLGEAQGRLYIAVFNWDDEPKTIRLSVSQGARLPVLEKMHGEGTLAADEGVTAGFGDPAPPVGRGPRTPPAFQTTAVVSLQARHSSVYRVGPGATFDELRRSLQVE